MNDTAAVTPHIDPEITKVDLAGLAPELALWGVKRSKPKRK